MVHGQIASLSGQIGRQIQRIEYDKILAAAIGTGIGLSKAVDDFGDYISRKRGWDDFTKPRRRKAGEMALDNGSSDDYFKKTYLASTYQQRGRRYAKHRKNCACKARRRPYGRKRSRRR